MISLSFIWIILLSIAIFAQWDVMNHMERRFCYMYVDLRLQELNMIIRFLNFDHDVHRHLHDCNAPNAVRATSLVIRSLSC